MKFLNLLIFALFLNSFTPCFAQDYQKIKRSNIAQTINGKEYYLHKVQAGETLSAISRAYHVRVEDITSNNYGLSENIKPGEIIKIPTKPAAIESPKPQDGAMNYHRVASGETLYSLSKEFNVSVDELKALNGGLPEGLKSGAFIIIPVRTPAESKSEVVTPQEKTNKDYFEYQAKTKTSIYLLAMQYGVSVDKLYVLNPDLGEQLNPGQIIKIPLISKQPTFINHTILKRQSMNKLARKYGLDVEELKSINPYISRHLEEGQVLRIPISKGSNDLLTDSLSSTEETVITENIREKSQQEICHNMYEMGSYDVALLLPFYFSVFDSLHALHAQNPNDNKAPEFIQPFVFIQFYEGFMMAVDSMKKAGLDIRIHVYNLEDNIQQTKNLLKNPDLKNMDLIVGPIYSSTFKVVAEFARIHQINIVNPLSTREETSYGNPYVFQPQPTIQNQNQKLVEYLNDQHDYSQIFIARHNPYRDAEDFERLRRSLNNDLESRKGASLSLYHEIIYSRDSTYSFEHLASINQQNVVVVYSEDKVFILDILRSLNELRDTFNITVVGMPNWKEIEGLESEDLNNLNAHMLSRDFTNYEIDIVRNFVRDYRLRYASEPKEFAFAGYDIGVYFLSALMKYGPAFNACIPYYDMELLNMGFKFESSPGNGFVNQNWKILGMEDYELKDDSMRLKTYDLSRPPQKYYKYNEGN